MSASTRRRSSRFLVDFSPLRDGLDYQGRPTLLSGNQVITGTFDRGGTAGAATSIDANGRVFTPGYKAPRFYHHYDASLDLWTPRGLLLEGARTNVVVQGTTPTTANGWTATGGSVASVAGSTYAGMAFASATGLTTGYLLRAVTLTGNAVKAFSFCVKQSGTAAGWSYAFLYDSSAGAARCVVKYTVSSGGAVTAVATTGTLLAVQALGDGVYRILATSTSCTATNTHYVYANNYGADGTLTSALLASFQVENAVMPSSIIPTAASTVTRSADALSFAFNAVPQAMTIYADLLAPSLYADSTTNYHTAAIQNSAGAAPYVLFRIDAGSLVANSALHHNGTSLVSSSTGTAASGQRLEQRMVLSTTGAVLAAVAIDDAAETSGSASSAAALATAWSSTTVLTLGAAGGGAQPGYLALRTLRIAAGEQTLAYMRGSATADFVISEASGDYLMSEG